MTRYIVCNCLPKRSTMFCDLKQCHLSLLPKQLQVNVTKDQWLWLKKETISIVRRKLDANYGLPCKRTHFIQSIALPNFVLMKIYNCIKWSQLYSLCSNRQWFQFTDFYVFLCQTAVVFRHLNKGLILLFLLGVSEGSSWSEAPLDVDGIPCLVAVDAFHVDFWCPVVSVTACKIKNQQNPTLCQCRRGFSLLLVEMQDVSSSRKTATLVKRP